MQGNQHTPPTEYRRRRRMDRLAGQQAAEEAYAAKLEQAGETEAETGKPDGQAAGLNEAQRWPVVEAEAPAREQEPRHRADRREKAAGSQQAANAPQPGGTDHARKPVQPQRAWQQQQPSDWTDHIRVVNDPEMDDMEEPQIHRTVEQLAVDRVVRLAATLASMCSLFALFLLFQERRSRALRHYAVQSVALAALNLTVGGLAAVVIWITGAIPVLGFVIKLACLLIYCGAAAALLLLRVRLMSFAWGGYRWDVPVIGEWLQRFVTK